MAKRKSTPPRRLRVAQTCPAGRRGDEVDDDGSRAFERWLGLGVLEEVPDTPDAGPGPDEDPEGDAGAPAGDGPNGD